MGGYQRGNQTSSMRLTPPPRASSASSNDAPSTPRVTLPSDLAGSLKYLDDAQLQMLLQAVTIEIDRRRGTRNNDPAVDAATGTSSQIQTAAFRNKTMREKDE